jgi:hypothetical protein
VVELAPALLHADNNKVGVKQRLNIIEGVNFMIFSFIEKLKNYKSFLVSNLDDFETSNC